MSTDDEQVLENVRTIYLQKKKKIDKKQKLQEWMSEKQKLEATLDFITEQDNKKKRKMGKADNLDKAQVEEVEDQLVEQKERRGIGFLSKDEVSRISRIVKFEDMNQSVITNVLG